MSYRPKTFNVPMVLLEPTYSKVNGVRTKTFQSVDEGLLFFGTFKTYGGTERDTNGVYVIEDTANIETWYNPSIKSNCRVALAENPDAIYEIISEPENIEMRNQYCLFKVSRLKGGA